MNIYYGYSNVYDTISFSVTHEYNIALVNGLEYDIRELVMKQFFPKDTNIIWTDKKPDYIKYIVVCNIAENILNVAIHERIPNGNERKTYGIPYSIRD